MKIAITAKEAGLSSLVDPRFGRAAYIIVVDTDSMAYESIDNQRNVSTLKGAGIQAATMLADLGVEVLMTGYCGPKAFQTLQAAEIKLVSDVTGTVADAVHLFRSGPISYTTTPNAEAHW